MAVGEQVIISGHKLPGQTLASYPDHVQQKIAEVMKLRATRMPFNRIALQLHLDTAQVKKYYTIGLEAYRTDAITSTELIMLDGVMTFEALSLEAWKHLAQNQYGKNMAAVSSMLGRLADIEWKRLQLLGVVNEALARRYEAMSDDELRSEVQSLSAQFALVAEPQGDPDPASSPPTGIVSETGQESQGWQPGSVPTDFYPDDLSGLSTSTTPSLTIGETGTDQSG